MNMKVVSNMVAKLIMMFDMQEQINKSIAVLNPAAKDADWDRAIWVECAEMMDHYGWKWWKQQLTDTDQVKLELVDIWHFALSRLLESGMEKLFMANVVAESFMAPPDRNQGSREEFRRAVENMAGAAIERRMFNVRNFANLMREVDMPFDELFKTYVGKNVLNEFRQSNGYSSGNYIKLWDGDEDNVYLSKLLSELDDAMTPLATRAHLRTELQNKYKEVKLEHTKNLRG